MTDRNLKCVKPPYKCNWCGEDLHGRYGRAIYDDAEGKHYCSQYCLRSASQYLNEEFNEEKKRL
jgi:hypothetical protein